MGHRPRVALVEIFMGPRSQAEPGESFNSQAAGQWAAQFRGQV